MADITRVFGAVSRLIGQTPLIGVDVRYRGRRRTVYAKCEYMNLTGSVKDRMALHVLRTAYERSEIRPGDTIAEATSGNTGISFSAIGRALGHPVRIYMPDWMSPERKALMRSYGAEIVDVSHEQGGFLGSIRMSEEFAATHANVFLPRQFSNQRNVEAHFTTTGPEIAAQLESAGLHADGFVAGVGTGGTVMGAGGFLKQRYPNMHVHPVEPAESPTLSTGCKVGKHRIQGISDEFIPAIMDLGKLDHVIDVCDGDAILAAQKLARELGLGVGISSGCNLIAAIKAQELCGTADAVVVTVFSDDNKKYLSTSLMSDEPVKDNYITPQLEFLGIQTLPRACAVCREVECEMVGSARG